MATPLGSTSIARHRSPSSNDIVATKVLSPCDESITMVEKKRKLATVKVHQSGRKRREVDTENKDDGVCKQMSIANLISSPPMPRTSRDSVWATAQTLADVVLIKPEKVEDDVETAQNAHKPVSSSNIPAAFLHTQAFANPRDFFVAPLVHVPGTKGETTVSTDRAHVVCTICQGTMGNRVYTLKRHLVRHHPHVFRVIKTEVLASVPHKNSAMKTNVEVTSWRANGTDQSVVQLKQTLGDTKSGKIVDSVGHCTQKLNDAFVGWLRSDVIPMKALQSELFIKFLSLVNPGFKMPQIVIQPQQLQMSGKPGIKAATMSTNTVKCEASKQRLMKGLWLQGNGLAPQLKTDLVVPSPDPPEALIEVLRAGICGTDLQMINNYKAGFKGALGHEFVGVVRKLGAQFENDEMMQQLWIGKRVVGEINIPCDAFNCSVCSRNSKQSGDTLSRDEILRRNHCPNRSCLGIVRKNGAFAEYLTLPVANLYEVPHEIMDSHAVFAEPLAAACRIVEQQVIQSSDNITILGDGKLGLMVAEVLYATKTAKSITLVGKHCEKLALAKHFVNKVYTLNGNDDAEIAIVARRMNDEMAPIDVCIESTGTPNGIALALRIVREGGTVVMKSTCSANRSTLDSRALQNKRVRVIGSRCGPLPWALRLLKERKIDVQKYIHGVYPLERAEAALAHAAQRGTLKIQFIIR